MNTLNKRSKLLWYFVLLCLVVGSVLTIVSFLELCSSECAEGHKWRLLGMPFEFFGLVFFSAALIVHFLSRSKRKLSFLLLLMLGSAIGAEGYFIYVQKFLIGHWCPICLSIASSIVVAFIAQSFQVFSTIHTQQENKMYRFLKGLSSTSAIFIGLLIAFFGTTKHDALEAAQNSIKESLAFGDQNSDIEVYLFTDWACPACRKLELSLENIVDRIDDKSKIFFVDHVIHPETLNYIPYHLSFMLKNKPHYFELRDELTKLSVVNGAPSEQEIAALAARKGVTYSELNYSDIALGIKYFKKLGEKFKVKGTPTMVIINTTSKKGKKLTGNSEITEQNVIDAITTLNNI